MRDIPSSHDTSVIARNTIGINPDLVEESRYVETGQIRILQPGGLHGPVVTATREGTLLEKKHRSTRLAQAVCHDEPASPRSNNDVVISLTWRRRTVALNESKEGRCGRSKSESSSHVPRLMVECQEEVVVRANNGPEQPHRYTVAAPQIPTTGTCGVILSPSLGIPNSPPNLQHRHVMRHCVACLPERH
jgi:hypothetical protein